MTNELIYGEKDVLAMLDHLLDSRGSGWWDGFYQDRAKPCPFFVDAPSEHLVEWVNDGRLRPGKALDLGCGNGRDAIFLARHGFTVEGVDYSERAITWAKERVAAAGVAVQLRQESVFDLNLAAGRYDLVCDSGCFHHLAPHRRRTYVERVTSALKPCGWFAMSCFRPEGGSGLSDFEVYERRTLGGGLGYTEDQLRDVWSSGLHIHTLRQMRKPGAGTGLFGEDFLWVLFAQKPAELAEGE